MISKKFYLGGFYHEKNTNLKFCICCTYGCLCNFTFLPFWSYDGISSSIQSYIWFPGEKAELTAYLTAQLGESYTINNIIWPPILSFVAAVVGVILCAMYNDEPLMCLIPIIGGLIGAWGYLTTPAFQLGGNWILHLVVCIAMILIGVLTLLSGQKKK